MSQDIHIKMHEDRLREAEVALLLTFYLPFFPRSLKKAEVAIARGQVCISWKQVFPVVAALP